MSYSKTGTDVQRMFSAIAGRYDLANSVLSFGIHHLWRRALIRQIKIAQNNAALDLCTGTADLVKPLSKLFKQVVGADFCAPMLEKGREKLKRWGIKNAQLVQADAMRLPFADKSFDLVTVAFGVRNFENLAQGLNEISRVLKPGGELLVLEFGTPSIPIFSSLYNFYSNRLLPKIGALLSGDGEAYDYLARTSQSFPCRDAFCENLMRAGFKNSSYKPLSLGIAYIYRAYL